MFELSGPIGADSSLSLPPSAGAEGNKAPIAAAAGANDALVIGKAYFIFVATFSNRADCLEAAVSVPVFVFA